MSQKKEQFKVKGMTCAGCVRSVENIVKMQHGVQNAQVNLASNIVDIEYDSAITNKNSLKKAVDSMGYELLIENEEDDPERSSSEYKKKALVSLLFTIPVFVLSMFFMRAQYTNIISFVLSIPVLLYGAGTIFVSAFKKLKHFQFTMDTLVAIGTGTAFLYSTVVLFTNTTHLYHVYFESAVVIITFILLGKWLEENAKYKTNDSVNQLMGLQEKEAILLQNNSENKVLVNNLKIGDFVLIKSGEKIPTDSEIIEGEANIDESMISGEPTPVFKKVGDKLIGGTINLDGVIVAKVTVNVSESVLSQIIDYVKNAQVQKAPIQQYADKIASVFVPIVLAISFLTFIVWYFSPIDNATQKALVNMVAVLVIACPCALGLATPTAIIVGMGKGASNGVLFKDAVSLQEFSKTQILCIDKTGTLTKGKPTVNELVWLNDSDTTLYKKLLYSSEKKSTHPLSIAISKYLDKNSANELLELNSFQTISGKGIRFSHDKMNYYIGSELFINELGIDTNNDIIKAIKSSGKTLVLFSNETQLIAAIGIEDEIKNSTIKAIQLLKDRGIKIIMLTGDSKESAERIANECGIEEFHASLLPSDKLIKIKELQKSGLKVTMVGDGINDAPALMQADMGVALSTGSDIAINTGKIILLNGDLLKVVYGLKIADHTLKTIKQNLFWAFFYNLVGIPLAAGVLYPFFGFLLNPMISGMAMAFSSVSVVLNSLRLRNKNISLE